MKLFRAKPKEPPATLLRAADASLIDASQEKILRVMVITGFGLGLIYLAAAWLVPSLGLRTDWPVYMRLATCSVLWLLSYLWPPRRATLAGLFVSFTMVSFAAWTNGGIRAPVVLLYPALAAAAGILLNRRTSALVGVLSVLVTLAMVVAARRGLLPQPVRPPTPLSTWVVLSMAMFVVTVLLRLSIDVLESALDRARKELAEREEVERVLRQRESEIRALNTDLEERVRVRTAELSAAKEAAESANRAKSTFLANMSHEIRPVAPAAPSLPPPRAPEAAARRSGRSRARRTIPANPLQPPKKFRYSPRPWA